MRLISNDQGAFGSITVRNRHIRQKGMLTSSTAHSTASLQPAWAAPAPDPIKDGRATGTGRQFLVLQFGDSSIA